MNEEKPGLSKRQKQSKLFGILLGLGVFLIIIAVMAIIKVTPYNVYESKSAGIRIKYPASWQVKDDLGLPNAVVAFISLPQTALDTYRESFNISFQDLSKPMSLDQFSKMAVSQFTGTFKQGIKIVDSQSTRLSGRPAYEFSYLVEVPNTPLKFTHIWTLDGNRAYILTYGATVKDYDFFREEKTVMIKSFKIL